MTIECSIRYLRALITGKDNKKKILCVFFRPSLIFLRLSVFMAKRRQLQKDINLIKKQLTIGCVPAKVIWCPHFLCLCVCVCVCLYASFFNALRHELIYTTDNA